MKKKILYLDMDGVLVDFQSGIDWFTKKHPNKVHYYKDCWDEAPIFEHMKPMLGAVEAFHLLAKKFDVYILSTAPWENPNAWRDKRRWVNSFLGVDAYKRLILTHHKELMRGDFLIDDRTANGAGQFEGVHIHFGAKGLENWDKVLKHINNQ
jgi:5'-nucleotidase